MEQPQRAVGVLRRRNTGEPWPPPADAVNWEKRDVKELKPDNPRAVRRGEKQLEGYKQELEETTGEEWTGQVETYKK